MAQAMNNQLAVVTGGSSGIGFELARQFVEHGYDVIIAAEDDGVNEAANRLQKGKAKVQAVQVDLATCEGNDRLYEEIKKTGRPVDAITLNAGVGVSGYFIDLPMDDLMNLINVNVMSPVHLARLVLPDMVSRNEGKILITSSIAATMPTPFEAIYGASKVFLLAFADSLRSELKNTDIKVTALMPGATDTNFFQRAGMEDTKLGAAKKDDPADVAHDGFEALMKGDHHIISHSLKSKMQGMLGEILLNPFRHPCIANNPNQVPPLKTEMDDLNTQDMALRLVLALAAGLLLGVDRDIKNKPVDFRAYIITSVTACLVALVSLKLVSVLPINQPGLGMDPSRIIQAVLMGIAFLGAATILKRKDQVIGTATGATVGPQAVLV